MSTRATIAVSDKTDNFHLYIHGDGGPDMVLPLIEKAKNYAWELPRFQAGDFAAAIAMVMVMKKGAGHLYLTTSAERHSDADYHYDISELDGNLVVEVYDYTGHLK